ncbi:RHS repeat-associated core domain-containing protein [Pseudomonas baetica]|uniref:RHS repeat-associated core domain-containing protein n=2 Tax=Pseudomonas TaxID=286 RepID=UPI00287145E3|nr:RHS repeat-associated core domain-containing protein [Pseudomonas baetica]MDR9862528.1 RHS repeat-associated core domain-containing protein [Pseudomonas baetica]
MSAALDWRTPSIRVHDSRDLPVRQIAYLRTHAEVPATALITRQHHDAAGHLVKQWDPRLATPNLTTVYGLGGEALMSDSVDAGWRLNLPGLAGQPLERWDERGSHWRTTFDNQIRAVAVEENGVADVDVFTYADVNADAGHNLRGKLWKQKDAAGELQMETFALTGQPLKETRTFLGGAGFTSQRVFSPLGAALEQTDAGGHRHTSHYGLAGHLKQLKLLIKGAPESIDVLLDTQYNAAEQITEQLDGNGVCSRWTYDPADGRLHTQSSCKDTGEMLQNFEYFYDPVANIIRIEDHAFAAVYFANQRVDGHRNFGFDSLYRLTSASGYNDATPPGFPGLPTPSDKKNRLNYTETYDYDLGGNLIRTVHVRDGANRTFEMAIDPNSNRGVRWKPGDPPPEFDKLFDLHGNQRNIQPGQSLTWNVRDELMRVTLIARGGGRDDAEHYLYSQGARVFKRHETFTATAEHFHQVRYLPSLEIRSEDNGEELHVISVGNARCLHWVKGQPADIPNNQMRYSLEDHLGSCTMELDQNARIISQEGYYPFGATAWLTAESKTEVSYKFIRYSGKEMDVSGLYYYGARYYAPWLQRWISPDPAGDVDGLNLYGFVGNNPIIHVDQTGNSKVFSEILNSAEWIGKKAVGAIDKAKTLTDQVHNLATEFDGLIPDDADIGELRKSMTLGKFLMSKHGLSSAAKGAVKGFLAGGTIGTAVPGIGNGIGAGVGAVVGLIAFPLLRYYFLKKGLKLAHTLHTQEIKDGLNTVSNGVEVAKDLINKGAAGANGLTDLAETLKALPSQAKELFDKQLNAFTDEQKLEFYALVEDGTKPLRAIMQVKNTVQTTPDNPSEADGVTGRLQALAATIAEDPRPRPVPKPRTKFNLRKPGAESFA